MRAGEPEETESDRGRKQRLKSSCSILYKLENYMADFAALMPVCGHAEEGEHVRGRPAIHTDMDFSREHL